MPKPFRTTVIGSYFRRDSQALRRPTLTREEANAHVRWAIDEQVRAGMEIIADGEQWAARAFNRAVEGLGVPIGLHVCFGNPHRKRLWHDRRYHDLLGG